MATPVDARLHRKVVRAWCMYDWANSAFATTIMAVVLPTFYSAVAGSTLSPDPDQARVLATSYWGYTNSITMLLVAFAAPILGAVADHSGAKKRMLGGFAALGIVFTALLVFIRTGDWLLASGLYVVGHIGFSGANIFYDSLLPHVAQENDIDQVSTRGYAMGYLGGGLLLALNLLWIMQPSLFGIPDTETASRLSFLSVAIWWAVFSLPLFRHVKEPAAVRQPGESRDALRAAFQRLGRTFRNLRSYRQLTLFVIAFWLYNDGIGTIITMAAIYGAELNIPQVDLIGTILMVQFVGVPFAFIFGWLARRLGTKPSILLALGVYVLIAVLGFFVTRSIHFWVLGFAVAMVQGGSQALSRSLFGSMAPKAKSAEFFGFYDISSKFAGILGPALFGFVGQAMGSNRYAILALVPLFVVGGLLLLFVNEKEGVRVAREEDAQAGLAAALVSA
ncbi:MAG: MFS transporter [Anaerolineae bacterium]